MRHNFVANFRENTTVNDFENWPTFIQVMNEYIVAFFDSQCTVAVV